MPEARRRPEKAGIAFMVIWLVVWTAAILVAVWTMGAAAWNGEPAAILFLGVWVVAAGFGLRSGVRRLLQMLLRDKPARRPMPNHRWDDGLPPPPG